MKNVTYTAKSVVDFDRRERKLHDDKSNKSDKSNKHYDYNKLVNNVIPIATLLKRRC